MVQIFRTDKKSYFSPSVTRMTFFLSGDGKLFKITAQTHFLNKSDSSVCLWAGSEEESTFKSWDFNDANADDLKEVFKELALRNPQDFKSLYYALREHDREMFPIIHSALLEVQKLFNFN